MTEEPILKVFHELPQLTISTRSILGDSVIQAIDITARGYDNKSNLKFLRKVLRELDKGKGEDKLPKTRAEHKERTPW